MQTTLAPVTEVPVYLQFQQKGDARWYSLSQPVLPSEVPAWMSPSWSQVRLVPASFGQVPARRVLIGGVR